MNQIIAPMPFYFQSIPIGALEAAGPVYIVDNDGAFIVDNDGVAIVDND